MSCEYEGLYSSSMDPVRLSLESTREARVAIERAMVSEMQRAHKEGKLVYVAGGGGIWNEICLSMGLFPVSITCLGHQAAETGNAGDFVDWTQRYGMIREVCSKISSAVGLVMSQHDRPDLRRPYGTVPQPDLIVQANPHCDEEPIGLGHLASYLHVPAVTFNIPFNVSGASPDNVEQVLLDEYVSQTKAMIHFIEEKTGTKFDLDAFSALLKEEQEIVRLAQEIDQFATVVPVPMNLADRLLVLKQMRLQPIPMDVRLEVTTKVRDEVKDRVQRGQGIVEDEKLRLMWCGVSPYLNWGIIHAAEDLGAVFAVDNGSSHFHYDFDPSKPFESLAGTYIANMTNSAPRRWSNSMIKWIKEYHIDGLVYQHQFTSRPVSFHQEYARHELSREVDIPILDFNTDPSDERYWDNYHLKHQLRTFAELMISQKETATNPNN